MSLWRLYPANKRLHLRQETCRAGGRAVRPSIASCVTGAKRRGVEFAGKGRCSSRCSSDASATTGVQRGFGQRVVKMETWRLDLDDGRTPTATLAQGRGHPRRQFHRDGGGSARRARAENRRGDIRTISAKPPCGGSVGETDGETRTGIGAAAPWEGRAIKGSACRSVDSDTVMAGRT